MASTALLAEDLNTLPMEPVCVLLFGFAGKKVPLQVSIKEVLPLDQVACPYTLP